MEGRLSWPVSSPFSGQGSEGHTQRLPQEALPGQEQERVPSSLIPARGSSPAQVIFSSSVPFLSHIPSSWHGMGVASEGSPRPTHTLGTLCSQLCPSH